MPEVDEDTFFRLEVAKESGEMLDIEVAYKELEKSTKEVELEEEEVEPAHSSGSARTEGYYKIDEKSKAKYLAVNHRMPATGAGAHTPGALGVPAAAVSVGSARSNRLKHRQYSLAISMNKESADKEKDLIKYNQLKSRKKRLKFERSTIHEWGLFALEPIASDDMVIEVLAKFG